MEEDNLILIVDDEPNNFDVLEMFLYNENYDLVYISNGQDALSFLEKTKPNVILLDIMMPKMNGIEVCSRIKNNPNTNHIPVIMVTALSSKENLAKCIENGADDFITKPIDKLELKSRIRSMVRIKNNYDQLKTLLQLREDMAQMIVHDLRNPLTTINLSCNILKLTDLNDKQNRKIDEILLSLKRLNTLINSLLIMSKLESNNLLINKTSTNLSAFIEKIVSEFNLLAKQNNIQLIYKKPSKQKEFLLDSGLLQRVIENLLSNAIKFSPANSVVQIVLKYLDDEHFKIKFMDNGCGVDDDLKNKIFEKYNIGEFVKGVSQIGLGLAFCKLVIDSHGGTISIEDNEPVGSVFTVKL